MKNEQQKFIRNDKPYWVFRNKKGTSWKLNSIDELYNRLDTVKVRTREMKDRSKETIQIYYIETEMQNVRG